ncbi:MULTISPECIES: type IV pilus secretin PilQ family protein [Halomonadaceae]|uniref:Type IV pilus secretin PilQ n=1 Tax=Vreelandella halophila TaxID=86177 RepID=A0A9X5B5K3_9GAMM|nr:MULTISPECIES: type IV pilus secretin PilQ family protein [Halomonas]MYL27671.1 type IV pilus secretin PilQ [Halomonas utahensis]MYL75401.1 type IV pilus secretin PilQ [Halomonas sp. 22501_18_FS]
MLKQIEKLLVIGALALTSAGAGALTLENVDFSSLSGDRTEIVLGFDGEPPEASGYTIQDPARITLDLDGVSSDLEQRYHDLGDGNAQSMTVVEAEDRTRLVLNLTRLVPHEVQRDGSRMVVTVGADANRRAGTSNDSDGDDAGDSEVSGSGTQAVAGAPMAPASDASLEGVDFNRTSDDKGEVVLDLSSSRVSVDMDEQAGKIRLDLGQVALPERLRRRLDVTDFGTPVERIDTFTEDGRTLVEVTASGTYDYAAYQTDDRFTLSVEKLTEQEAEQRQEERFPYDGEKLSLNFQDIEVRSVLQLIADFTGLNLVASDTVTGSITLRLENVPWDQALDIILQTKGLDKRRMGNVLLVAPAQEIAEYERQELETERQMEELRPVRLETIQVNYAKAGDIVSLLREDDELISDRGFISSDDRTNTISVRETAPTLKEIRDLVETWDRPVRQVLIEARIVQADVDVSSDMGIAWGVSGNEGNFSLGGSSESLANAEPSNDFEASNFPADMNVDLGVSGTGASSAAIGFTSSDFLLDLELSALESDGQLEIVSQPKVVTADRQEASIKSGEEIPYQEATSSGATNVSFKEAALGLNVTPQITPDDNIIMDLEVNQDSRGQVTAGVPSINTRSVQTQVLVGDGETVVLGGIYESEVSKNVVKTPFLGDIPYLGALFRQTSEVDTRTELLIFVTPRIMESNVLD